MAESFAELSTRGNELVEDLVELGAKKILSSVDEAAVLCKTSPREGSRFEILSKALSALFRNLFGLFLDTNSRISEFLLGGPAFRGVYSRNGRGGPFSPFIAFPNFGVFKIPRRLRGVFVRHMPSNGGVGAKGLGLNLFGISFDSRPIIGS